MAEVVWKSPAVDWTEDGVTTLPTAAANAPGQVKVTTLHYSASLTDGTYTASTYGTTPDDGNRVYPLPALESVPEDTVVKWVKQALGDEEVARIEQALADNLAELQNPTSGTVTPGD